MALYPNQQTVRIDKKVPKTNFAVYGKEEMGKACSELNGSAFKVWCYLLSNSDGVLWDISPAAAFNNWGIPRTTFHDGLTELKEKGYIVDGVMHQVRINPTEINTEDKQDSDTVKKEEFEF